MDKALSLAMRSTVLASEHAFRARKIAFRLRRMDMVQRAIDLAVLLGGV
jgi:hypothetical protein